MTKGLGNTPEGSEWRERWQPIWERMAPAERRGSLSQSVCGWEAEQKPGPESGNYRQAELARRQHTGRSSIPKRADGTPVRAR